MKQLSGIDHLFLQMERGNQFMHVAALGIYDPSTSPGGSVRFRDVLQVLWRAHRGVSAVSPPARHGAAVARSSVLGRGCGVRRRVPRAPHRTAPARRLAPALYPGRAAAFPPARSQQAALGGVRHRRSRQRGRRAGRQFRAVHEGPPCADRWRVGFGDHARDPLAHAGRCRRGGTAADGTHRRARSVCVRDLCARLRQQPGAVAGPDAILAAHGEPRRDRRSGLRGANRDEPASRSRPDCCR